MKKVKYTVMDSCGNVSACIAYQGAFYGNVGDSVSLPSGQYGTLIRAELVLEADTAIDTTKPV